MLYKVYEDNILIATYNTQSFAVKDFLNVDINNQPKERHLHTIKQSIASGEYEEHLKSIHTISINLKRFGEQ